MVTWSFSSGQCISIMLDDVRIMELVYNDKFNMHIMWSSMKANNYWDEILGILKKVKSILRRVKKL